MNSYPHRRYNFLTGDWVLVSPHRTQRPWRGQIEKPVLERRPAYDPECCLCPGNRRAGEAVNPGYTSTHVFSNDFPALLRGDFSASQSSEGVNAFFRMHPVNGECRVLCFSPRHDLSLAEMDEPEIRGVVEAWALQDEELGRRYAWVQIFENKGAAMGCSNPHPHGQIWACNELPNEARAEDLQQRRYFDERGSNMLADYAAEESKLGERVVVENDDWVALVPYWAVWPFEILLIPRLSVRRLRELNDSQRMTLSQILKRLLVRYDNLFETSFPYSMGWHGAPNSDGTWSHWQLHAHWYPPLLRSATVRKFMVGYEMLAEPQRDITPAQAARQLRAVSERHYKG